MSSAPLHAVPESLAPTGHVPLAPQPEVPAARASSKTAVPFAQVGAGLSPQGYVRCTGPFAAYSHSASEGRRPPSHSHAALAWSHVRPFCGCRSRPSTERFVYRLLAKRREERFDSAAATRAALEAVQRGDGQALASPALPPVATGPVSRAVLDTGVRSEAG